MPIAPSSSFSSLHSLSYSPLPFPSTSNSNPSNSTFNPSNSIPSSFPFNFYGQIWIESLKDLPHISCNCSTMENHQISSEVELQITLDVNRSLTQFEELHSWSKATLNHLKKEIFQVTKSVFCINSGLHYYQGFHDLCSVVCITLLNQNDSIQVMRKISIFYLGELMTREGDKVHHLLNDLCFQLLSVKDGKFASRLKNLEIPPYFITSWILTWCCHDVIKLENAQKIIAFLLRSPPISIIYLCVCLLLDQSKKLPAKYNKKDDIGEIHQWLKTIPKRIENMDKIIENVARLLNSHPPEEFFRKEKRLEKRIWIEKKSILTLLSSSSSSSISNSMTRINNSWISKKDLYVMAVLILISSLIWARINYYSKDSSLSYSFSSVNSPSSSKEKSPSTNSPPHPPHIDIN